MNCSRFETLLSDYLENSLEARVRMAMEEHLGSCPSCPSLLGELGQLKAELGRIPPLPAPPGLLERILESTTGKPRRRSLWADLVLPTLSPFLTQRFAMATVFMFVFASLIVSVLGPGFSVSGADLTPSALIERADRFSNRLYQKTVEFNNYRNRLMEEFRFLRDDLYGRLDYHLINLLFERYSEALKAGEQKSEQEEETAAQP